MNQASVFGSIDLQKEGEDKNSFETSHELCKDAMLEKIVLISVGYFCIATEMRFIMQKVKNSSSQSLSSMSKKDSETYHAKALHICSLFLPKECPLVQHVTQSYGKNYLKDKKDWKLETYLKELGIKLQSPQSIDDCLSFENDIDEGIGET